MVKAEGDETHTPLANGNFSMETLLTLISAWAVYGVCQNDPVLPLISTVIVTISFLLGLRNPPEKDSPVEKKIRWLNPIGVALLLGWMWRG